MNSAIIQKFGIEKFAKKLILNIPADITDFDGIAFNLSIGKNKYDLIFAFVFTIDEFLNLLTKIINKDLLNVGGVAYFAYPKKGNRQYKEYIGRDDFFDVVAMDSDGFLFETDIKFNKMAAFNEVFTVIGLKHEVKRKKSVQPSQCVSDYTERLPELRNCFEDKNEVLALFDRLTPGYQRDWARYVFGVKNQSTTRKRLAIMEVILKQGYKSLDSFRREER